MPLAPSPAPLSRVAPRRSQDDWLEALVRATGPDATPAPSPEAATAITPLARPRRVSRPPRWLSAASGRRRMAA